VRLSARACVGTASLIESSGRSRASRRRADIYGSDPGTAESRPTISVQVADGTCVFEGPRMPGGPAHQALPCRRPCSGPCSASIDSIPLLQSGGTFPRCQSADRTDDHQRTPSRSSEWRPDAWRTGASVHHEEGPVTHAIDPRSRADDPGEGSQFDAFCHIPTPAAAVYRQNSQTAGRRALPTRVFPLGGQTCSWGSSRQRR
jgi:hypothetical protein